MLKTPDEIKKGLECCVTDNCKECPYYPLYEVFGCKLARAKDALALIQQLEVQNTELLEKVEQLQAERDAAVESMRNDPHCCYHCANMTKRGICQSEPRADGRCFKWRGVQKEE